MMRYFVNPETGLAFALPESEVEKMLVRQKMELIELDMEIFRVIFEGYDKVGKVEGNTFRYETSRQSE